MTATEALYVWSRAMPAYWYEFDGTAEAVHAWFHTTPLYWHGLGVLGVIALYTFLTAVALPLPSELVLAVPLHLGAPWYVELGATVVAGACGSATGAAAALLVGRRVAESSRMERVRGWVPTERLPSPRRLVGDRAAGLVDDRGVVGLVVTLAVPLAPDTLCTYGFTALEADTGRYAVAAFAGNALRLCVAAGVVSGALAAVGV